MSFGQVASVTSRVRPTLRGLGTSVVLYIASAGFFALAQTAPSPSTGGPTTATGALTLINTAGRIEVLTSGGMWRAPTGPGAVALGLRTGTGRAQMSTQGGRLLVGSASELRVNRQEADLRSGQFVLNGPITAFALSNHLFVDGVGRMRVDLSPDGTTQRVAMISGQGRVALGNRVVRVQAGQQVALKTGQVSAFREMDPWYAAQFAGLGTATVQATRGLVQVIRATTTPALASVGDGLAAGERLTTASNAWAEIAFTGGGYLRLTEQSELGVIAIEKTAQGREVTLQLLRGTAWNVVQKGQGGYRITTPVVSTAVRGTVFRVDASGTVKVFEGQVALPSQADLTLGAGQQQQAGGMPEPLVPDALDAFNQALDAERARPLRLRLDLDSGSMQDLALAARSLPDAQVAVEVAGRRISLPGNEGLYQLSRLEDQLPEGRYQVTVQAARLGQSLSQTRTIDIDRSAPVLSDLKVSTQGRILTVSGRLLDTVSDRPVVTVQLGSAVYTRSVPRILTVPGGEPGHFLLRLPAPPAGTSIQISARDRAGNESHAALP